MFVELGPRINTACIKATRAVSTNTGFNSDANLYIDTKCTNKGRFVYRLKYYALQ
jgi:hypothetical protein